MPAALSDKTNMDEELLDCGPKLAEGQSLQDAFARFRRERKREHKLRTPSSQLVRDAAAAREAAAATPGGAEARRRALRATFIETAKQYIGVPYAERYHEPGDPLHGQPLYLDCCALVRRALQDMQKDFGFRIGRWNQAYQFDTLPVKREFEQLEPGDLVFVEGTYHTGRHRQQKHNMVHVEIYLGSEFGTGPESTIGSRDRWGCVKVHDSFKYESRFYDIHGFHWRSIDTWLEGKCEPTLLTDAWSSHDPYGDVEERVGRRSIFSADEEEAADVEDLDEAPADHK